MGTGSVSQSSSGFARLPREEEWRECVARIAGGQEAALTALYDQTSSLVYGLAMRILGDPFEAEEVTLDVYTQVWRSASRFDARRGTVTAWLVMLARSRAIDRLRAASPRNRFEEAGSDLGSIAGGGDGPEEASSAAEQQQLVRAAVAGLAPDQRQVIELAYFGDMSHTEIAERLGLPLGTVKTRIRLGMMKLREQLGGAG
jgi:RNA polymerase sigma-70 factor (ECF subfamily)